MIVFLTFFAAGDGEATGEFEGAGVGVADATAAVVVNLLMS